MYSRKSVGPRMEPSGTPASNGYTCEDLPSRTTWRHLLLIKRTNKASYLILNSIRRQFVKKTSIPNSAKSLGYIKCCSLSSPRPLKSPSNSIRYNCEKICSCSRRPKALLKIRKKAAFLYVINNPITYKLFKDFTNHRKNTNSTVVLNSLISKFCH